MKEYTNYWAFDIDKTQVVDKVSSKHKSPWKQGVYVNKIHDVFFSTPRKIATEAIVRENFCKRDKYPVNFALEEF